MKHSWQQPIRPLEYCYRNDDSPAGWSPYHPVLFIRPTESGFEIMGISGSCWPSEGVLIRRAD